MAFTFIHNVLRTMRKIKVIKKVNISNWIKCTVDPLPWGWKVLSLPSFQKSDLMTKHHLFLFTLFKIRQKSSCLLLLLQFGWHSNCEFNLWDMQHRFKFTGNMSCNNSHSTSVNSLRSMQQQFSVNQTHFCFCSLHSKYSDFTGWSC